MCISNAILLTEEPRKSKQKPIKFLYEAEDSSNKYVANSVSEVLVRLCAGYLVLKGMTNN